MDYALLAEPQLDGSDTAFLLEQAKRVYPFYTKPARPESDRSFSGIPIISHRTQGEIHDELNGDKIAQVGYYLLLWPAGMQAFRTLVDEINFVTYKSISSGAQGCYCGNEVPTSVNPMRIMTSTFDPIGGAEGIVHETGHLRLHCLGVHLETHDGRILANDPSELYESPIRKDKLRPMSAVLQGLYSYVNVTQLDIHVYHAEPENGIHYLKTNVPRIEEGLSTILAHAKWAPGDGERWGHGFITWTERVIAEAKYCLTRQ